MKVAERKIRRYVPKIGEDPVIVPAEHDMDDETFLLHLEKRHAEECRFESTPVHRHAVEAWLPVFRAFHARLHNLATPGQYDHEHEEEE